MTDKEFSIIEAENEFLQTHRNFAVHRPGFYPSSASIEYVDNGQKVVRGTCLRKAYYQARFFDKDPSSIYLKFTGIIGKVLEGNMIDRWKHMGLLHSNNIKFYNRDLVLSGELDAIVRNPKTNGLIGIEAKTYYGPKAERSLIGVNKEQKTGRAFVGKPKDYQFLQALLYAWEYREELEDYRLYYFDRGNGNRLEFRVGLDRTDPTKPCWYEQIPGGNWKNFKEGKHMWPFSVKEVQDRYKTLLKYVKSQQVPPKDYSDKLDAGTIKYMYDDGDIAHGTYEKWLKNPDKYPISHFWCNYCDYTSQCKKDN
jgi:hypothetical protein